ALVLQGGLDRSLALSLTQVPLPSTAAALIDRILLRVDISESGLQSYRSRFLVNQLNTRQLDVDLPIVLPRGNVEARLGSNVVSFQLIDETGRETDVARRLRLRLPTHLLQAPTVLEIKYEIDATRVGGNGPLQST